jgi:hypothetical protein
MAIAWAWPHERQLMEIARPVQEVNLTTDRFAWVSTHQLLIVTTDQIGKEDKDAAGKVVRKDWRGSAELLDIDTHRKTHLEALTKLLSQKTVFPSLYVDCFKMSPDGVWLSWTSHNGRNTRSVSHAAHLDGSRYRAWKSADTSNDFFLDAGHILQMPGTFVKLAVRDLGDPSRDREDSPRDPAETMHVPSDPQRPFFLVADRSSDAGKEQFATIETYRTEDFIQVQIALENKDSEGPKPVQTREVELVRNGTLPNFSPMCVAPRQDAICYHLQVERVPHLFAWLQRWLPKLQREPTHTEELWSSDADGRRMQEVGSLTVPPDAPVQGFDIISDLQWLPDGKQVSFVYDHHLYVVSVR